MNIKSALCVSTLLISSLIFQSATAQQSEQIFFENYASFASQEMYYKSSMIKGIDGFIYSCGATLNENGNYDLILSKLTSQNVIVWSVTYAGVANGDDFASDLVQDSQGNIIVTGAEFISSGDYNALTIKYSNSGILLWLKSYNGSANSYDGGVSVVADQSNNLYIVGATFGTTSQSDFLAIKYSSSGTQLWASTWNSIGLNDLGGKIAINSTQVALVGVSQQSATAWKMAAVYFNPTSGSYLGSRLNGGNTDGLNRVSDVAIDSNDNTYLVGAVKNLNQGLDLKVIKLSSNYDVVWQQTINGTANANDEGLALELTSTNDIVTCGYVSNSNTGKDIILNKLNGLTGSVIWSQQYDEEGNEDKGIDLKLDNNGEIILCSSSYKLGNLDFLVSKYSSVNGALKAKARWNGDSNLNDSPLNLAVDNSSNCIYVVGQSEVTPGKFKYVNTKWVLTEVILPTNILSESGQLGFIENRGQLRNLDLTSNTTVKYYSIKNNVGSYINDSILSYQVASFSQNDSILASVFRVDLSFDKANSFAPVHAVSEKLEYYNFYLSHMISKAERTSVNRCVVKSNVYPHVDFLFSHAHGGYKNYLIAKQGADLTALALNYNGQSSLSVDAFSNLVIGMGSTQILQLKPSAFVINPISGVLLPLNWQISYVVIDDKVTLTGLQSWTGILVITFEQETAEQVFAETIGNLDWSTYIGNNGEDQALDVVADANENVWVVGEEANAPFAGNIGQAILNSSFHAFGDAYAAKFLSNCQLRYMTVWGGSDYDRAFGVDLGENSFIYTVGYTQSSDIIGTSTAGMNYNSFQGGFGDGFYLKLNDLGVVEVDSYIGGAGKDVCTSICFRKNQSGTKEIWIAGYTNSESGFPISGNPAQIGNFGGGNDGFVLRLDGQSDALMLGRWVGSLKDDFVIDIDDTPNGPIFIGITFASDYSSAVNVPANDGKFPNYIQGQEFRNNWFDNSFSSLGNYFLGRIDNTSNLLNWTTFFGASPEFLINLNKPCITIKNAGMTVESESDIYICGSVPLLGSSNFPTYSNTGNFNQVNFGGGVLDAFVGRFRSSGTSTIQQTWCSFLGGISDDNAFGLAIDKNNNVFVTGWVDSQMLQLSNPDCQLPPTGFFPICNSNGANYMETNISNSAGQRTFIASFDKFANILWSSEFGSNAHNTGRALAAGTDKLFLAGIAQVSWTLLEFDPNSSLDYYQPFVSGIQDGTIARFDIPTITGIEERTSQPFDSFDISVYPNPSNNMIQLNAKGIENGYCYRIVNSSGQLIQTGCQQFGTNNFNIDISQISSGVYNIIVTSHNNIASCSFIKI